MADKDEDDKEATEEVETDEAETDDDADESGEKDEDASDPEVKKAIARRDRALARARKAEARVKELEAAGEKDEKPDPIAVANSRLVKSSARALLASTGITDREDQKAVIEMIRLDDIDVDDEGPDEDAIEERISDLRRIFGAGKSAGGRTPRTPSTRDKGGAQGASNADPDTARYRRFMAGRG